MELNEFFKSYSLEAVNEKTNIPFEVLEKIKNKEWDKLKKVQASGFLKILEREFEVDLSEAKQECEDFYKDFKTKEPISPIDLIDAEVATSSGNRIVSVILGIITIAAIVYSGWFYYNKQSTEYENGMDERITVDEDNNTTYGNINSNNTNKDSNIIDQEQQNSSTTTTTDTNSNGKKFDMNSMQGNNTTDVKPSDVVKDGENNLSILDNRTKKEVEFLLSESERNRSQGLEQITTGDANKTMASDENKTDGENTLNGDGGNLSQATLKAKKLWIGIYNLDTKKKESRIIKNSFNFDLNEGDLVIVTGHGKFDLVTDNDTKSLNTAKKQYILLSKKDGIKFLTKQEYRTITKKRAW